MSLATPSPKQCTTTRSRHRHRHSPRNWIHWQARPSAECIAGCLCESRRASFDSRPASLGSERCRPPGLSQPTSRCDPTPATDTSRNPSQSRPRPRDRGNHQASQVHARVHDHAHAPYPHAARHTTTASPAEPNWRTLSRHVVENERAPDGHHQALRQLPSNRREPAPDGPVRREAVHW